MVSTRLSLIGIDAIVSEMHGLPPEGVACDTFPPTRNWVWLKWAFFLVARSSQTRIPRVWYM